MKGERRREGEGRERTRGDNREDAEAKSRVVGDASRRAESNRDDRACWRTSDGGESVIAERAKTRGGESGGITPPQDLRCRPTLVDRRQNIKA